MRTLALGAVLFVFAFVFGRASSHDAESVEAAGKLGCVDRGTPPAADALAPAPAPRKPARSA